MVLCRGVLQVWGERSERRNELYARYRGNNLRCNTKRTSGMAMATNSLGTTCVAFPAYLQAGRL